MAQSDNEGEKGTRTSWQDSASVAKEAIPEIDLARERSVRLIISIPVLMMLLVLGSAIAIYVYIDKNTPRTTLTLEAVARVGEATADNREAQQLINEYRAYRQTTERLALSLLVISIPLSLLAGAAGFLLAQQIVRPIRRLTSTMESISRGDFTTKVQPIRLGEFGELGTTFNRMVEQLNDLFEERDRQLRGSFDAAHLLLDPSGIVLQADGSAARLFESGDRELVGSNLLLDPDGDKDTASMRKVRSMLRSMLSQTSPRHAESRAVTVERDNGRRRLLLSCTVLEGQDQRQILLEVRDISGISNFYEQIQRADRLAAVGTLATGIAHEIRNPLASIRGMAQLLGELADAETTGILDYSNRIIREADRLEKLVRSIMDFAQSGEANPELTDINTMLREVVESVRHQVRDNNMIEVRFDLDGDLPLAYVQPDRLRQALTNLVLNAFQHCREHDVGPVSIQTMHLKVNHQRPLIIGISNPCEALDEAKRARLFEPFYTTKSNGTGLGLPIAYQIVSSNGGILEVEFDGGQIQFWVRLPRDPGHSRRASGMLSEISMATPLPISGKRP